VDLAVSRGFLQAPDTQAYERACETIPGEPEVQRAVEELIDKMILASRKHKERRRAMLAPGEGVPT
jgi:hypothetical protein